MVGHLKTSRLCSMTKSIAHSTSRFGQFSKSLISWNEDRSLAHQTWEGFQLIFFGVPQQVVLCASPPERVGKVPTIPHPDLLQGFQNEVNLGCAAKNRLLHPQSFRAHQKSFSWKSEASQWKRLPRQVSQESVHAEATLVWFAPSSPHNVRL